MMWVTTRVTKKEAITTKIIGRLKEKKVPE